MNKKERQAYLQELLNKELEELRVRCFPYQRRDLLYYPVTIREDENMSDMALGEYITEGNNRKIIHRIKVNPCLIDDIINFKYTKYGLGKKYYKRRLKQTIRHELTHAFVFEEWEEWTDVKGTHRDASPIFLTTLKFLKGVSHHDAAIKFTLFESELYLKTIDMVYENKTYDEFRTTIIKLIAEYEKEIREINAVNKNATKFEFSHRDTGLKGSWNITTHVRGREGKMDVNLYNFEIGSRILPKDLRKLTNRKINNGNFEIKNEEKYYCFSKEKVVKLWEKKNY